MQDIIWDSENRDIVFGTDGDFALTSNPSTQNGAILLEARCMNIIQPSYGIGFNSQVLGSNTGQAVFQLNRWVQQVQSDGGKASWQQLPNPTNVQFDFNASVSYDQ